MKSETQLTAEYVKRLRHEQFAKVLNLHGHDYQERGWPDVYIVHWKFRGWVEFKGLKTKLEPLQIKVMEDLIKRGDNCFVIRFFDNMRLRISTHDELHHYYILEDKSYALLAERLLIVLGGLVDGDSS